MGDTVRTFASYAVDDLDAARTFYGETLGLQVSDEGEQGPLWLHANDSQVIMIYTKPHHTPADFTVLNVVVEDIAATVDELAHKGVSMERFEGFPVDDRGIHHEEGRAVAWFTDPAGNVLSLAQFDRVD